MPSSGREELVMIEEENYNYISPSSSLIYIKSLNGYPYLLALALLSDHYALSMFIYYFSALSQDGHCQMNCLSHMVTLWWSQGLNLASLTPGAVCSPIDHFHHHRNHKTLAVKYFIYDPNIYRATNLSVK